MTIDAGTNMVEPTLFLPELAGAVARQTRPRRARQALAIVQRLARIRFAPLRPGLARRAARLAADLRLAGGDAVYLAVAERVGFTLVSWDGQLKSRGSAVVAVQDPAELLRQMGELS